MPALWGFPEDDLYWLYDMIEFSCAFRKLRKNKGLTKKKAAQKIGISPVTLSGIERSLHENIHQKTVAKILAAFPEMKKEV